MMISRVLQFAIIIFLLPACTGPENASVTSGSEQQSVMTARSISFTTADFVLSAESAEAGGGHWRLSGVALETHPGRGATLKVTAPEASFDAQSGRVEAAGGVKAVFGQTEVRAARAVQDGAADSFRLEGGLMLDAPGIALSGSVLTGRLGDVADFKIKSPRLRLKQPEGK